jgi:hypothetical protein
MSIQTPHSDRLAALKQKLQKHPGRQGGKQQQPYQAPTPYSGAYDSTVAGLGQSLQHTQTDLAGQGLALQQQYGFGADQSNPFSVARQLERSYGQRRMGTETSAAAGGHLYDGSLSTQKSADRYDYEQSQDSALRDYQAKLAGLTSEGVQAQDQYEQGTADAYAQRLQDALSQPPDPTEAARRRKQQGKGKQHEPPKKGRR